MEESWSEETEDEETNQHHIATVVYPDANREDHESTLVWAETQKMVVVVDALPVNNSNEECLPAAASDEREASREASTELATILGYVENYFVVHARPDNLEAMSFSLRHLFSRVDYLYRQALPSLDAWSKREEGEYERDVQHRQQIWLQLQAVNRTLDRMAPLCHLLSDVIECLLDTLDNEENWLPALDVQETMQMPQITYNQCKQPTYQDGVNAPDNEEHSEDWERAVTALMDRLLIWQEQHHKLVQFTQQFTHYALSDCHLQDLDTAFAVLLDSAAAIFGDILPNFRLLKPADREEIGALLFDLMQQSDQMLVQFEMTLEPMNKLIRHFAGGAET